MASAPKIPRNPRIWTKIKCETDYVPDTNPATAMEMRRRGASENIVYYESAAARREALSALHSFAASLTIAKNSLSLNRFPREMRSGNREESAAMAIVQLRYSALKGWGDGPGKMSGSKWPGKRRKALWRRWPPGRLSPILRGRPRPEPESETPGNNEACETPGRWF